LRLAFFSTEPNYNQVCSGATGHTEAVVVYYDPSQCSYADLLDTFFARVNPTTINGQGSDYGRQYRTGVYTHTTDQAETAARRFEQEQLKYKKPIATELKVARPFWPAEKYHQQYLAKGGRFGTPQDTSKGATDEIRCYG
jgi:peptide-methionine (S)-S-oxide reductase